jgi:hypothetical protein
MTFHDLPENWSDLPLDTSGLAADVADLVVGDEDRLGGCLGLVLVRPDLTMGQPCVITGVDDTTSSPTVLGPFLDELCGMVAETGGALLFVRGRDGSVLVTDSDRRWHQVAIDSCRRAGVRPVGAFLATSAAVRSFPAPFDAALDDLVS